MPLEPRASPGTVGADKLADPIASGLSEDTAGSDHAGVLNLTDQYMPTGLRDQVTDMTALAKSGGMSRS